MLEPTPTAQLKRPNKQDRLADLCQFVSQHPRLLVLTGAGISTESGIPDYRDHAGAWKHPKPMQFQEFIRHDHGRKRYWGRSMLGWRRIAGALPNAGHRALVDLEASGGVELLLTQNVDGLHQRAGSMETVDLHGRLDTVVCLDCGQRQPRKQFQATLESLNPGPDEPHGTAPDGDVVVERRDWSSFQVPDCDDCGGILKPDVVFFGESVPQDRVQRGMTALATADALLVVGSSLMVYSGFRFARAAGEMGKPIAAINLGQTRADPLLSVKFEAPCGEALAALNRNLGNL